MKGTVFMKDKKVMLSIGEPGKVPAVTLELLSPQFIFDGDKVTVVEGELTNLKK
jgi:hypothetical protein